MTLGEFLKRERIKKNLTKYEFSKEIGISRVSYLNIENDKIIPGIAVKKKIITYFDKTPLYIADLVRNSEKKILFKSKEKEND